MLNAELALPRVLAEAAKLQEEPMPVVGFVNAGSRLSVLFYSVQVLAPERIRK